MRARTVFYGKINVSAYQGLYNVCTKFARTVFYGKMNVSAYQRLWVWPATLQAHFFSSLYGLTGERYGLSTATDSLDDNCIKFNHITYFSWKCAQSTAFNAPDSEQFHSVEKNQFLTMLCQLFWFGCCAYVLVLWALVVKGLSTGDFAENPSLKCGA